MEKRGLFFAVLGLIAALAFANFLSADLMNASVAPTSANASQSVLYNFTINNTNSPTGINFTQVNITFSSGFSFNLSTNGTSTSGNLSSSGKTLLWSNTTNSGIIPNGTKGYFWINATASDKGTLSIYISTTDNLGNRNSTVLSVSVSDITSPQISFDSSFPSNNSKLNQSYIYAKFDASDNVGISNVNISLIKPSGVVTKSDSSSPYSYNFTNLTNGTYIINATVYDTSGNLNSTGLRYVILNFTSASVSCSENWTCSNWTTCVNGAQNRTCADQNSCGTDSSKPSTTQTCVVDYCDSGNNASWDCGNWTPSPCVKGQYQIQNCTDSLGNCPPKSNPRLCPSASQSSTSASSAAGQTSNSSVSWLFLGIVGFIILSVIIVVMVLMKMRKKNSGSGQNYGGNSFNGPPNSGYPPGGPPRYPSPAPPRYEYPQSY